MKRIVIVVFLLFGYPLFAQGVWLEGELDCGEWLTARKQDKAQFFEHYIVGVVNGLAAGRSREIWRAAGIKISREQLYFWMDSYCQKNPLSDVISGTVKFSDERTNEEFSKKDRFLGN